MMRLSAAVVLVVLSPWVLLRPGIAGDAPSLEVRVSNVSDVSFVVTWMTKASEPGQVRLLDGTVYEDDRGASYRGWTHYVTVSGLQPKTAFSFDVISGGIRFDNAGSHWTVTTAATLEPRAPDVVTGKVLNADGTNAHDVVVFATIYRVQGGFLSIPQSALVTPSDGGIFRMRLSDARTLSDPSTFMDYTPYDRYGNNEVTFQAIGPLGSALVTVEMADPNLRASDPLEMITLKLTPDTPPLKPLATPTQTVTPTLAVQSTLSSPTPQANVVVETQGFGIPDYAIMVTDFGTQSVAGHEEIEKNHYRDFLQVPLDKPATLGLTVFIHSPDAPCADPAMENCNYVQGTGDKPVFRLDENRNYWISVRVNYTRGASFLEDEFSVTWTIK
jgi:hypothetical protein